MAHFIEEQRTIHAPWWEEGESVTVRRFTWYDEQVISEQATEIVPDDEGGARVQVNRADWHAARMERGIVEWTLRDAEGERVPCTPERIRALSAQDGDFIYQAIRELNERRSAEEQAGF